MTHNIGNITNTSRKALVLRHCNCVGKHTGTQHRRHSWLVRSKTERLLRNGSTSFAPWSSACRCNLIIDWLRLLPFARTLSSVWTFILDRFGQRLKIWLNTSIVLGKKGTCSGTLCRWNDQSKCADNYKKGGAAERHHDGLHNTLHVTGRLRGNQEQRTDVLYSPNIAGILLVEFFVKFKDRILSIFLYIPIM